MVDEVDNEILDQPIQKNRIDTAVDRFADFVAQQDLSPESGLDQFKKRYVPLVTDQLSDAGEVAEFETKFNDRYSQINTFSDLIQPTVEDEEILDQPDQAVGRGKDIIGRVGRGATNVLTNSAKNLSLRGLEDLRSALKQGLLVPIGPSDAGFSDPISDAINTTNLIARQESEVTGETIEAARTRLIAEKLAEVENSLETGDLPLVDEINEFEQKAFDLFQTNPELDDQFVSKVFEGAGSIIPGLFVTLVTRNPLIIGGSASAIGTQSNSFQQFEEALTSGADLDSALKASNLGSLVGLSEGVPLGRTLRMFKGGDTRFGTILLEKLSPLRSSTVGRISTSAVTGAFEEAAQEFITEVANNAIQIDATGLREDQEFFNELLGGTEEAATIGGTVGAVLNTVVAAIGTRRGRRRAIQEEQEAAIPDTADEEILAGSELDGVPEENIELTDVQAKPLSAEDAEVIMQASSSPDLGEGPAVDADNLTDEQQSASMELDESVVSQPQTPEDQSKATEVSRTFRQYLHPSSLFSTIPEGSELLDIRRSVIGAEHDIEIESSLTASNLMSSIERQFETKYTNIPKEQLDNLYFQIAGDTLVTNENADIVNLAREKVDQFSDNIINSFDNAIEMAERRGLDAETTLRNMENARATVEANIGTYLNRSFRVFDDRSLLKNFSGTDQHTLAVDQANQELFDGNDREAAQRVVDDFVADANEAADSESFLINSLNKVYGGRIKFQSIFNQKQQLSRWVRTVLHEDTDPVSVLQKTLSKQGFFYENLNAQTKFMDALFEAGLADSQAKPGFVLAEESAAQGAQYSLLGSVYIHKDIKDSLEALYGGGDISTGAAAFNLVNLTQKVNATVLSTSTQTRNAKGAVIYALMNGAANPKDWINTYRQFREFSQDRKQGEYNDFKKFLVRERIISDSAHADELRDLALTIRDSDLGHIFSKDFSRKLFSGAVKGVTRAFGAFAKTYRLADEFSKVVYFNKELRFGVENLNLSNEQAMDRAAQMTRSVMPTATNTPALVNRLRRPRTGVEVAASLAGGTFLTFNAEVARNVSNIIIQSKREVLSGDPTLIRKGVERFLALAAVGSMLVETALPDENELNPVEVNRTLPWYYSGKEMRGGEIDDSGDVRFKVTHYSNPISMFTNSLRLIGEAIFTDNISPQEAIKFVYDSTLGEFFGGNMTSQNIRELYTVDGTRKTYDEALLRVMSNIAPRLATDAMKIADDITSVQTPTQTEDLNNRLLRLVDAGDFILRKEDAAANAGRYLRVYKNDLDSFIRDRLLSDSAQFDPDVMAARYVREAEAYLDKSKETISELVKYQDFLKQNGFKFTDDEAFKSFKGGSGMTKGMFLAITEGVREGTLDEITPFTTFSAGRRRSRLVDPDTITRRAESGRPVDDELLEVFEEREQQLREAIARLQLGSN